MKRKLLVAVPLLCVVAVTAWFFRPKHEYLGEAYVSERSTTLWSSVALVREPIDTLHYGDRVDIMARRNDSVKVRTVGGAIGWVDARLLLEPALWQRSVKLLTPAKAFPWQGAAATKVRTIPTANPGRRQRVSIQFGVGCPFQCRCA